MCVCEGGVCLVKRKMQQLICRPRHFRPLQLNQRFLKWTHPASPCSPAGPAVTPSSRCCDAASFAPRSRPRHAANSGASILQHQERGPHSLARRLGVRGRPSLWQSVEPAPKARSPRGATLPGALVQGHSGASQGLPRVRPLVSLVQALSCCWHALGGRAFSEQGYSEGATGRVAFMGLFLAFWEFGSGRGGPSCRLSSPEQDQHSPQGRHPSLSREFHVSTLLFITANGRAFQRKEGMLESFPRV